MFTKQEDSYCKFDQFCVDTFSLPVSLAATGAVPIPIPRAITRSADLALWPVEMFTISCSSYLNGWISWLLTKPVILFTPSFRLAYWCPCGAWVIQIQVWHCLCLIWFCGQNCKTSPVFHHGCWLMTNGRERLVLASRLYVFSNVMSL